MKYFFDTEFIEGPQQQKFLGISVGITKPTIDMISIGIVAEDGRKLYEISKDFNVDHAWDKWQWNTDPDTLDLVRRIYWIRENVLKPIFKQMVRMEQVECKKMFDRAGIICIVPDYKFNKKTFKKLIKKHGISNETMARKIKSFCGKAFSYPDGVGDFVDNDPRFYAYYADYDWVVFCWLFGTMMELPKGFPMYCRDLKQMYDEAQDKWDKLSHIKKIAYCKKHKLVSVEEKLKHLSNYPHQENEHSAIDDAEWDEKLYEFLLTF